MYIYIYTEFAWLSGGPLAHSNAKFWPRYCQLVHHSLNTDNHQHRPVIKWDDTHAVRFSRQPVLRIGRCRSFVAYVP